jgi:hypothetical protein
MLPHQLGKADESFIEGTPACVKPIVMLLNESGFIVPLSHWLVSSRVAVSIAQGTELQPTFHILVLALVVVHTTVPTRLVSLGVEDFKVAVESITACVPVVAIALSSRIATDEVPVFLKVIALLRGDFYSLGYAELWMLLDKPVGIIGVANHVLFHSYLSRDGA